MALQSPGVDVTVIDESFYSPADGGTTPLVVVATAQDKQNASGTGTAVGTLASNAGTVYRITSQRELAEFFGTPIFKKTVSGSPRHGDEQNEYGLQAAYSFLGVANQVYVVRADIDLNELTGTASVPGSDPKDGQWWLDTQSTTFGVFEWDGSPANLSGQKFVSKTPIVITADDTDKLNGSAPASSVGKAGDYAIVTVSDVVRLYYKGVDYTTNGNPITWELVGSNAWRKKHAAFVAAQDGHSGLIGSQDFQINNTVVTFTGGANIDDMVAAIKSASPQGIEAVNLNNKVTLYVTGTTDGDSTTKDVVVLSDGSESIQNIFGMPAGTYYAPDLAMDPHTAVPSWKATSQEPHPTGSVWVKTTEPNQGSRWRVKVWSADSQSWLEVDAPLYETPQQALYQLDRTTGGQAISKDSLFVQYNYTEDSGYDGTPKTATWKLWARKVVGPTTIISEEIVAGTLTPGQYRFEIRESLLGQPGLTSELNIVPITVTAAGTASDSATIAAAINNSSLVNIEAEVVRGKVQIIHKLGGEFRIFDEFNLFSGIGFSAYDISTGTGTINLYATPKPGETYDFVASNWVPLAGTATGYVASNDAPTEDPTEGQRWYSSLVDDVDIMVHNGTTWVGYQNFTDGSLSYANCDPLGPIVSASRPTTQSDGSPLVSGDIWIDSSDLENYPVIYKFNNDLTDTPIANRWVLVDKTDNSSQDGIVFADARWGASGAATEPANIVDLLGENYIDPDAPDPALYPKGVMLFNTRRSGFNIKVYRSSYISTADDNTRFNDESMAAYNTARWVTDSGTRFGRKAQRESVVEKLKETINTNQALREDEVRLFNLMACPGYPEVLQNLVDLNLDRGTTAFVVGDSPFRLSADTPTLSAWGNNIAGAGIDGEDGLVTSDEYTAVFYPSGLTSDNTGSTVVVPPSHMMLKTIALSDQVSYPWFAPAGIRRGGVSNATAVGYVGNDGVFNSVALTDNQRNTLYDIRVNPITFFNGVGLVNYGQRTRAAGDTALDRINVARLVIYLRTQLNRLAKPFVFEPNDKITRDEIKQAVESLLLELVGLRALYDFAVVCDESNNTAARIDRNELYVDIAIEPVKSIEFIYIPLRLKNTGEIQGQATA